MLPANHRRLFGLCVSWFAWSWLLAPAIAQKPQVPLSISKLPVAFSGAMENTPFVFGGQPFLALNFRDDTKNNTDGYKPSMYLFIRDLRTGQEVARLGEGHSFVNVFVNGPEVNVFASEGSNNSDVDLFEWEDRTWLYYATGDQATWGSVRVAMYDGPIKQFYESCFPAGEKPVTLSAQTK